MNIEDRGPWVSFRPNHLGASARFECRWDGVTQSSFPIYLQQARTFLRGAVSCAVWFPGHSTFTACKQSGSLTISITTLTSHGRSRRGRKRNRTAVQKLRNDPTRVATLPIEPALKPFQPHRQHGACRQAGADPSSIMGNATERGAGTNLGAGSQSQGAASQT